MQTHHPRSAMARDLITAAALALGLAVIGAAPDAAAQSSECLLEFQDAEEVAFTDGGQACGTASNKACTFNLKLCTNQERTGCTPGDLKKKIKAKGHCGPVAKLRVTPNGTAPACGDTVAIKVRTKKNGQREGKCTILAVAKVKGGAKDQEKLNLVCKPNPGDCPTTTTTSIATTTTTSTSTTSTTVPCPGTCCPTADSLLSFTTGLPAIGGGGCGSVKDANNTVLLTIDCGGLYTGGGGNTLPLPSIVPDMGTSYTKTTACAGQDFTLAPTVPGDHAGLVTIRNCTSAGIANPIYKACVSGTRDALPCLGDGDCPSGGTCTGTMPGCLFGPPLPLPNSTFAGASVCIVNRVSTSASGSGNCATGSTSLALPLASDLYLLGDLLDGSAPDRPSVAGIQPCPMCTGTAGAETCQGGPRHGLSCTPGSTAGIGGSAAHPTSHDCPPPPGALGSAYIGALPIPFNLTTDATGTTAAAHKVATLMNTQEVFCGFCASNLGTNFKNPPVACTSNADCAGITGCPGSTACGACKQRTSGAFATPSNPGAEHEITVLGATANECLSDGLPHDATLVSAFCIPPAFNATVDANGDLPGPGATALKGKAQLIP